MQKIFKNIDKPLLIISIILFIFGLIMILSASNVTAYMRYSASPYVFFRKELLFLISACIIGIVILHFKTNTYYFFSSIALIVDIVLLFVVRIAGMTKGHARSWIPFGPFSLQPSEFIKLIIIVFFACYYDHYKDKLDSYSYTLAPVALSICVAGIIFFQPDLGTTIIFSLLVILMFLIVPMKKEIKQKSISLAIGLIAIVVITLSSTGFSILTEGQKNRLLEYGNPCSKEKFYSSGNQVCNAYIAINNGGFKGVGFGNSTQKYLYLPEAHTDFIFAIIMEEVGLVGASVIFVLYFLIIGRILKIGKDSVTQRGSLICYGVAMLIFIHIVVNLGGVFGLLPLTGVPLPFLSYGGSFCITLVFALTFVQRVNIENRLYLENMQKEAKERKVKKGKR